MSEFDPFAGNAIERTVDSTEAQREIWLASKYGGEQASLAYNESVSLLLEGKLDHAALRNATSTLLGRHDALRSTFSSDGQTLVVNQKMDLDFRLEDYRQETDLETRSVSNAARSEEVNQTFNLATGPLIRFRLLVFPNDRAELILTAHHIICDGWSFGILISELDKLYSGNEKNSDIAEPAPSFADHALADRASISGQAADSIEHYWAETLGTHPSELDLPTDFSRISAMIELEGMPTRSVSARRYDYCLDSVLSSAIIQTAKSNGVGLSAFLLAAFTTLLSRLSGQNDFIVGVPAAAQAHTENYNLVGHCVQMLPVRILVNPDSGFPDFSRSIKSSLLDGFENQKLTFSTILQRLRLDRDPSRVPLIPVIFNVDQALEQSTLGNCELTLISNPRVSENFELFLNITPDQGQLQLELTYRTGLFKAGTIKEWCSSFEATLSQITNQPDSRINDIHCLSHLQRQAQLSGEHGIENWQSWSEPTVVERITTIARSNPLRIAIQDQSDSITYQELINRANQTAFDLHSAGVDRGSNVAICRAPGIDLVTGILGIWKMGCAYLPLDPAYPESRLRYVLRDTSVEVILGEGTKPAFSESCLWLNTNVSGQTEVDPALIDKSHPEPEDSAYIIHTSGSTGDPKGVIIDHAAFNNFIGAMMIQPGIEKDNHVLAVTSLSFDISTLELFLPLCIGAKVTAASTEQSRDGFALARLLHENDIDYMQATPSGWRMLLDVGWQGNTNMKALCGGESLPLSLAKELSGKVSELWNMYGPTEATVWSTVQPVFEHDEEISLGKPVTNTTAYILDEERRLLPPGASGGELYLGGAGLAQGYFERPELTASRFVNNPFSNQPDSMLYRTGDRVRLGSDGQLYFLGRLDHQIKIRGFRIEMGELENALEAHPDVAASVATLYSDDDSEPRLVAYVTASGTKPPIIADLHTFLAQTLPAQCIPQNIIVLDHIPLTDNGKYDRNALPDPEVKPVEKFGTLDTDTQQVLGSIWRDLLRLEQIGPNDDFFISGGHSMIAVRMLARIRDHFGFELPLQTIFQDRTIAKLSARIDLISISITHNSLTADNTHEVFEF